MNLIHSQAVDFLTSDMSHITGSFYFTLDSLLQLINPPQPITGWFVHFATERLSSIQGGHGTGKTGNLVLNFSRQGKHREFCFDTGKNFETQGKYFFVTQEKI